MADGRAMNHQTEKRSAIYTLPPAGGKLYSGA
jgi:hypothetical protein